MRMARRSFLALGAVALWAWTGHVADAGEIGSPVILRLGDVVPTPAPSPTMEERVRIIESLTMLNTPEGESTVTFRAADYGETETGTHRTIAIEQYSLVEPKPEAKELRDEIVRKLRDLERDLLKFVEITGPPRAPEAIQDSLGSQQPYR
jgi:hypothetical protein